MTFFILYGTKQIPIYSTDILLSCPCCEKDSRSSILFTIEYQHLFYIPFLPKRKLVDILCKECGLARNNHTLDTYLKNKVYDYRKEIKYPFFTYSGFILLVLIVAGILFSVR